MNWIWTWSLHQCLADFVMIILVVLTHLEGDTGDWWTPESPIVMKFHWRRGSIIMMHDVFNRNSHLFSDVLDKMKCTVYTCLLTFYWRMRWFRKTSIGMVTVHVTLFLNEGFSNWIKSFGQNNHEFLSLQLCRESNLEQNDLDKFF